MAAMPAIAQLRRALHPLHAPPDGPAWNAVELEGLLADVSGLVPAAVLVGLVPRASGFQVLLTRRNAGMRHHPGQVSFPGGRIEAADAGPAAAALREAEEETGIPAGSITPLGFLDPLATISGFRVLPLVATLTPGYIARPDPREVEAIFEVPLDWLLAPAHLRQVEIDAGGRPRTVLEFVEREVDGQRIWGASASILYNLRERLGSLP